MPSKGMKSCHLQNVDGIRGYYAKKYQSEKGKISYYYIHMWNLRDKTNEQEKKKKGETSQESDS